MIDSTLKGWGRAMAALLLLGGTPMICSGKSHWLSHHHSHFTTSSHTSSHHSYSSHTSHLSSLSHTIAYPDDDLKLLSAKWSPDGHYIVGKIKNVSGYTYRYADVYFGVYDKDGDKIGTAEKHVENLEPGETWAFRALVPNHEDARRFRFSRVDGYVPHH
jgi:hypothetical protein